jgi:predicted DNA-binding protein
VRTTIVLPVALDQNLEILCAQEGKTKNKAVIEALDVMIRKAGLQPFKQPKKVAFTVKY